MENNQVEIDIRALSLSDLSKVMEIEPVAYGSHHWSRQSFANELNSTIGSYFAAINSHTKELVGYSGFWLIGEEAHITTLAVHPDFRRRYIGERLLLHSVLAAKQQGARWLTLEVRVSNTNAQDLYTKYGFRNLGTRSSYYQDNDEDALVLWTDNIGSATFIELVRKRLSALQKLNILSATKMNAILSDPFFTRIDTATACNAGQVTTEKSRDSKSRVQEKS